MPASELAITLARLCGWTDIECRAEDGVWVGRHPDLEPDEWEWIPQPDTNDADAFALICFMQNQNFAVSAWPDFVAVGAAHENSLCRRMHHDGTPASIRLALATACKESLLACEEKP